MGVADIVFESKSASTTVPAVLIFQKLFHDRAELSQETPCNLSHKPFSPASSCDPELAAPPDFALHSKRLLGTTHSLLTKFPLKAPKDFARLWTKHLHRCAFPDR
eukprot:1191918-Prorocentrum_minimum.AAC.1